MTDPRRPRIAHIISGLSVGGAEHSLYNLLRGGLAETFNNHVISLRDEGDLGASIRALGVPVTAVDIRVGGAGILRGLLRLRAIIRKFQPVIIQGWMYHGNLASSMASWFPANRPQLAWNVRHSLYDLKYEKPTTRLVIRVSRSISRHAAALLYNSHLARRQHEEFGFSRRHGQVIPNGVDTAKFAPRENAGARIRSELGISPRATVVGHVARFHPMKNHLALIQAAETLANSPMDLHFVLCGSGVSLENEILARHLTGATRTRFHLLGQRNDIADVMNAMDIFCLCSAWGEGFPNVVAEAMATGIPCVVTDVGDSSEVVGDCGVAIPAGDSRALATSIGTLASLAAEKRAALGKQARHRITSKYALDTIVVRYRAVYEELQKLQHSATAV